jgi:hypothetical protein
MICKGLINVGSVSPVKGSDGKTNDQLRSLEQTEDWTQGQLLFTGGGELRPMQRNWVVPVTTAIHDALELPSLNEDNGQRYRDFAVRTFQGLTHRRQIEKNIHRLPSLLPYASFAQEDYVAVRQFRADKTPKPMVYGMTSPIALMELSGVAFGYLDEFESALAVQARAISTIDPGGILQWEIPIELSILSMTPIHSKRTQFLQALLKMYSRLIRATPRGTRHAFHLCWGDLAKHQVVPGLRQTTHLKVDVMNGILDMSVWEEGYVLAYLHDPEAASENEADYKDLRPFRQQTIYAMGVLLPGRGVDEIVQRVKVRMHTLGQRRNSYALSALCGDGRTPPAQVKRQYEVGIEAMHRLQTT